MTKLKNKKLLLSITLFIITFILMSAFKNSVDFIDEADNMLAAMKLANGGKIYLDYYAHHMPLMYYILYPFALMGIKSTYTFRICFYGILSLIWAFIYFRYSTKFDSKILFLFPFLYICLMSIDVNYTAVADHIQAQGLVILLLELLLFCKSKTLNLSNEIMISFGVFSSIFSVFTSIVSIGILALIVLIVEIKNYYSNKGKFKNFINYFLKKYYRLFLIISIPFIVIIIYYFFNGSLKEFYRQAFYFNTKIYSQYQDYPSNPINIILYTISNFFTTFKSSISIFLNSYTYNNFLLLILFVGLFLYLLKSKEKNKLLILLYVISCGNRSFVGFHAFPFYGCTIIIILLIIMEEKEYKNEYCLLIFILFFMIYAPFTPKIFTRINNVNEITKDYDYVTIQKITERENDIYFLNMSMQNYVNTNRLPATRAMTIFPWFQDMFEKELLDDLKKNNPRIIVYSPVSNIWNYIYQDYLELIDPWIKENYLYTNRIRVGNNIDLWIRKDYVSDVEKKLNINIPDYNNAFGTMIELPSLKQFEMQIYFEKEYVKNIAIMFNTFDRTNTSNVKFVLTNENNEEIYNETISANILKNAQYYFLNIDKKVNKNEKYKLTITNENDYCENFVSIYGVILKNIDSENSLLLNNEKSDYEPVMTIEY